MWLGLWDGEYERVTALWLRYYDQAGALLPTGAEAERKRAAQEASARQAAETRARELEAEVARLRAEIARGTERGFA